MTRWQKICAIAAAAPSAYICFNNHDEKRVNYSFEAKKKVAKQAIHRYMLINGVPGVSVGVTVNGKSIWKSGVGYADIEQNVKCNGRTVMRIASISKSVTAVMAAKLVEDGKLDVDAPIQKYLENFPKKTFDGKPVEITSRQLMSHTSGIRHYKKANTLSGDKMDTKNKDEKDDKDSDQEFYLNKEYKKVADSLEIFQNDDLEAAPGSKFVYTTFGYSLLSHVMEKTADKEFGDLLYDLTIQLGMQNTRLDRSLEVVPNRSRYYRNNKHGKLENVPEVNNSYKWAGGGLLSDVGDLLTLGNALMYSYQADDKSHPSPLFKQETIQKLWKGEIMPEKSDHVYGWGWSKRAKDLQHGGSSPNRTGYYYHTGAAVGASSVLLIRPTGQQHLDNGKPYGTCVAVLSNKQDAGKGLTDLALELSEIFSKDFQKP